MLLLLAAQAQAQKELAVARAAKAGKVTGRQAAAVPQAILVTVEMLLVQTPQVMQALLALVVAVAREVQVVHLPKVAAVLVFLAKVQAALQTAAAEALVRTELVSMPELTAAVAAVLVPVAPLAPVAMAQLE